MSDVTHTPDGLLANVTEMVCLSLSLTPKPEAQSSQVK